MLKEIKIIAKFRTKCNCGKWAAVGSRITWAPNAQFKRRTIGCENCGQSGVKSYIDDDWMLGPDDYPIFHDKW